MNDISYIINHYVSVNGQIDDAFNGKKLENSGLFKSWKGEGLSDFTYYVLQKSMINLILFCCLYPIGAYYSIN